MILVDSSAWIEFDHATSSAVHRRLVELIQSDAVIATTPPIDMEVLAGARDESSERRLRGLMARAVTLSFDSVVDFAAGAQIYRLCRSRGVTPRSLIDCTIASVAMRHAAAVLAQDLDFARIARVMSLELDPATPTEG